MSPLREIDRDYDKLSLIGNPSAFNKPIEAPAGPYSTRSLKSIGYVSL
jgi:hypothetical protein